MEIVVVGSIGYDDIETPIVTGSDVLGGSAVHAGASAAFHLPEIPDGGARVGLVGPIGDDFSISDSAKLEDLGIDFSGVQKLPGKTFRWSGKYSGKMENVETISTEVNVLADFSPEIPEAWRSPRILFCANTHPASQIQVLDQCPSAEITAIDTFMLWIETEYSLLSQALRMVDIAILNEEEVCAISGEDMFMKAIDPILSGSCLEGGEPAGKGPRGLIIKRGSSGVIAYLPCGIIALPSYPIKEIADPTGCGDSFAGALLANISGRKGILNDIDSMRDAMVHATVSSSFTIEGLGTNKLQGLERGVYHARMDNYRRIIGL